MTKIDVALQYFEDKIEKDGILFESEVERVCTKLGFSFGERISLKHALEREKISIEADSATKTAFSAEARNPVKHVDKRPESKLDKPKRKTDQFQNQSLNKTVKTDPLEETSMYYAGKIDEYFAKNYPLPKEKGENSDWILQYLPKETRDQKKASSNKAVTEKINKKPGPVEEKHVKPKGQRDSRQQKKNSVIQSGKTAKDYHELERKSLETSKLRNLRMPVEIEHPEKIVQRILRDYPCFKGLIADELCLLHQLDSYGMQNCSSVHLISEEEKIRLTETLLYDVFISAYRRAKNSSLDFEDLLSECWLELSVSIERCRTHHNRRMLNDYIRTRMNRLVATYKKDYSADKYENEISVGLYEDMCADDNLSKTFILRKKSDFETFYNDVELMIERCSLNEREKSIVTEYFGFYGPSKNFEEIAAEYDLTRSRIQQIFSKAMRKLSARIRFMLNYDHFSGEWVHYWYD